jgi:hypothetical protein
MQWPAEEIAEEQAHQQKMLRILRERRRILEIQTAQRGIDARPETMVEIRTLNEEIARHECEAERLESLAAEEHRSYAEVKYRMLLAKAWDVTQGKLTVVNHTRLEVARLKLRLMPDHARGLETEIREELAQEVLARVDADIVYAVQRFQHGSSIHCGTEQALVLVGQAIRLAPNMTIQWLLRDRASTPPLSLDRFETYLLQANKIGWHSDERPLFEQFFSDLRAAHGKQLGIVAFDNTVQRKMAS